ncbi:MAG: hypothetical protein KDD51_10115 [Bdellovibrionales bacterium]|nr:hypothetical protein [Bdellovibrionales bacterium]
MAATLNMGPLGVRGLQETQNQLLHYFQSGRIHPALLLTGPDAETKIKLAIGMAKWLVCPKRIREGSFDPNCPTCARIGRAVHPDVYVLSDPESTSIKIESVRELCYQMGVASMEGGPKVCVIDECHRMTPAAANAFLKSLEEPAADRYFIFLTTQPGSLLNTILSRCLQFRTTPSAESEEGFEKEETEFEQMMNDFLGSENTLAIKKISDRETGLRFLQFLQRRLRSAIYGLPSPFSTRNEYQNLRAFDATLGTEGKLRSNANHALLIENLLIQHFTKDSQL